MLFRLYSEEELPAEFKLYLPVQQKGRGGGGAAHPHAQEGGGQPAIQAGN